MSDQKENPAATGLTQQISETIKRRYGFNDTKKSALLQDVAEAKNRYNNAETDDEMLDAWKDLMNGYKVYFEPTGNLGSDLDQALAALEHYREQAELWRSTEEHAKQQREMCEENVKVCRQALSDLQALIPGNRYDDTN